jgi:hypothetical protein
MASKEQQEIVEKIKNNNIIVDCVVGSGKTSTIFFIAENYPNKKILVLTYNKKLRLETLDKAQIKKISNLDIHTFHSYYVNKYDKSCFNDTALYNFLNKVSEESKDSKDSTDYDIIVVDEAQDLNNIYFKAVVSIINKNKKECNICIIGDRKQSIYDYNGSDSRYIIYADKLFKNLQEQDKKWCRLVLSKTFRCSQNICKFIADNLNGPVIKSDKIGPKIRYIMCNQFSNRPYKEILYYKDNLGIDVSEIIVLAPSVKNPKTPIRTIANKLSEKGIPVYCALSDNEKLDSDVLHKKIVFCTFHQAKGLERKAVIVLNFDNSYTKYYNKSASFSSELNNELYVAITRSSEHLSLVHHYTNDFLPFMKPDGMYNTCSVEGSLKIKEHESKESKERIFSVTDLLRHLSHDTILLIKDLIDIDLINAPEEKIIIMSKVKQLYDSYENVSDITGVAVPSYYEFKKTGKMTILENLLSNNSKNASKIINKKTEFNAGYNSGYNSGYKIAFRDDDDDNKNYGSVESMKTSESSESIESTESLDFSKLNYDSMGPQKLLFIANKWICANNMFLFKVNQIIYYNWLTQENLDKTFSRIDKWLSSENTFEVPYSKVVEKNNRSYIINGIIDCISGNNVFEFKCVDNIDYVHYIQLALYKYISDSYDSNYFLLNIIDNSCYRVDITYENCKILVDILLDKKTEGPQKIDDDEFLRNNS